MKRKDLVLICSIAVLAAFYALSFVKEKSSVEKRESIKSALINPKNAEKITRIELSDSEGSLTLAKDGSLWTLYRAGQPEISCAADRKRIENFITDFTQVRNMYKISDKITKDSSFGLTDSSVFSVRYYYDDSFDELFFGNQDFSLSSRYMMSGRNTTVYEINDEVQKYLTASVQGWSEPYLVSRFAALSGSPELSASSIQRIQISGKDAGTSGGMRLGADVDLERLLELRHGGLPESREMLAENGECVLRLIMEMGDRSSVTLEFFVNDDESYVLKSSYQNTAKNAVFHTKISAWTYNRIKEITL